MKPGHPCSPDDLSKALLKQFGNFFNSYAKSFNKVYARHGRLFEEPFGRRKIDSEIYYANIINYIHHNAVKHGISKHIADWPFSSYHQLLKEGESWLKCDEVLHWFGGKEAFRKFHEDAV